MTQPTFYKDPEPREHERANRGQSVLIIFAMFALLGLTGFAIWGPLGIVLSVLVSLFLISAVGRASPKVVLKMYKAKAFGPRDLPQLQKLFDRLVDRANLEHKPQLYYVPSKMLNAFATGRGDQTVVAVTHGLLQQLNNREIAGVLAHELSHIKHRDVWVMSLADVFSRLTNSMGQVGQIMLWISLALMLFGGASLFPLPAIMILVLAPVASTLLQLALSRSREYEADFGAAQITGDPSGLASALRKVDQSHRGLLKKVLMPGRKENNPAMLRTHPPTEERIERLMAMEGADVLPMPVEIPTRVVNPPPEYVVVRRPRWHILTGLWH